MTAQDPPEERQVAEYILAWTRGRSDFYVGDHAAIYKNGALVWEGYSDGSVDKILEAIGIQFRVIELPDGPKAPTRIDGPEGGL